VQCATEGRIMRGSMHGAALDTQHHAGAPLDRFVPHFDVRERHDRATRAQDGRPA
jgi:hypothetical protein